MRITTSILSLPFILIACATTPSEPLVKKQDESVSTPKANYVTQSVNSRFQWAIQYYEAGQYEKALVELQKIAQEGPEVERFDLVDFFQGMSFFHLSKTSEAGRKLEMFLQRSPKAYESQEARMALLRVYELEKNWPKLVSLAAETDNEDLYFENRALLKLLWAQALNQLGEYAGAERVLNETSVLLNNLPSEYENASAGYDLRRELQGRYRWTYLSNKAHDCSRKITPTKGKPALLKQWADGYGECLVQASHDFFRDSRDIGAQWVERSQAALFDAWKDLLMESRSQAKERKVSISLKREIDERVQRSFAQFLFLIEKERKAFQYQPDKDKILKRLAQSVESLLSRK